MEFPAATHQSLADDQVDCVQVVSVTYREVTRKLYKQIDPHGMSDLRYGLRGARSTPILITAHQIPKSRSRRGLVSPLPWDTYKSYREPEYRTRDTRTNETGEAGFHATTPRKPQ